MTNRTKAVVWIVGVFLAGTLFGGGVATLVRTAAPSDASPLAEEQPSQGTQDAQLPPPSETPQDGPAAQGPLASPDTRKPARPEHRDGHPRDGRGRDRRGPSLGTEFRRMANYLNLGPEQSREVARIFRGAQQRMKEMDREMHQRRSQIRRDIYHSIHSLLNPEQKEKLEEWARKRRQRGPGGQPRFRDDRNNRGPDRDR